MAIQKRSAQWSAQEVADALGVEVSTIEGPLAEFGGVSSAAELQTFAAALNGQPQPTKRRGSNLAKAQPQAVAPASTSAPAPAGSRIDAAAYQNSLAQEIAQPLIDAHRQVTALEDGLAAAAEHLKGRKQAALDNFYQAVAEPAQTQELNHFFSQIPEEFKIFFPSVSGS